MTLTSGLTNATLVFGTERFPKPVIPVDAECWQEVMVDLEGPSQPADKQGNKYSFTYIWFMFAISMNTDSPGSRIYPLSPEPDTCLLPITIGVVASGEHLTFSPLLSELLVPNCCDDPVTRTLPETSFLGGDEVTCAFILPEPKSVLISSILEVF